MKKIFATLTLGAVLSAAGCMTPGPLVVPTDPADRPEPRPMRLPPAKTNVDPAGITEANYVQEAAELDAELNKGLKMTEPKVERLNGKIGP